ncbi:MAG: hypothetical protein AB7O96_10960 [Pseudobdellovibrionaceae bacterium]
MKLALFTLMMMFPLSLLANAFSTSMATIESPRMPGTFRVGILGSMNVDSVEDRSTTILAAVGSGMVSFEAGVSYLTMSDKIEVISIEGEEPAIKEKSVYIPVKASYVGIPVNLKWNYIEKPLATFYVKAGVMPISLNTQSKGDEPVGKQETLAVGGIGGTAAITKSTAFVLDITSLWNNGDKNQGIPSQSLHVGAGLSYDL